MRNGHLDRELMARHAREFRMAIKSSAAHTKEKIDKEHHTKAEVWLEQSSLRWGTALGLRMTKNGPES